MRSILMLLIGCLLAACGQNSLQDNDPQRVEQPRNLVAGHDDDLSQGKNERQQKHDNEQRIRLDLSGNLVDVVIDGATIQVIDLPSTIKAALKLRTFERLTLVPNIDALRSVCQEVQYKSIARQSSITGIRAKAYLNPFTTVKMNAAIIYQGGISLTSEALQGSFDAINGHAEITAPFLTSLERDKLAIWLNRHLGVEKTVLAFTAVGTLDLDRLPEDPTWELARVICGILDKEAYIDFVLTDKDGRTLTTRIDSVEFSLD